MSLRNNKAAKLNRYMMFGMFFLGIIVLGCVFGFLYLAYNGQGTTDNGQTTTDSLVLVVNDSTLLEE
jgi:hypothetical protein